MPTVENCANTYTQFLELRVGALSGWGASHFRLEILPDFTSQGVVCYVGAGKFCLTDLRKLIRVLLASKSAVFAPASSIASLSRCWVALPPLYTIFVLRGLSQNF